MLKRLDSDLVVVNEIRQQTSFSELADACGFAGRLLGDARERVREIHTGIMTRLPVLKEGQWLCYDAVIPAGAGRLNRLEFRRPVPWMKLELANRETLLAVGVHLKSRRPEFDEIPETENARRREILGQALAAEIRVSEAAGLRCLLDQAMEARAADHFAVLGDFNDPTGSVSVGIVCGARLGDWGKVSADDAQLFPASLQMGGQVYSFAGKGRKEMIDQLLVSRGLHSRMVRAGVESQLLEPHQDPEKASPGSDHAPVWAEFNII